MLPEAHLMPSKPKSFRYMWLIPVVMLVMAMLACDEVYVPPPIVDRVEADAEAPGRAYARVVNVGVTYQSVSKGDNGEMRGYETSNYGESWKPSEHQFAETSTNSYAMEMYGETLNLNGYNVWSFPRPIFRGIFYEDSGLATAPRFELPQGHINNSAQGNVVYVAMGTQGVLVAKVDGNGFARDWKVVNNGIDALTPLPLTITQPNTILGVLLFIFIVPPFALIHIYLLQQVWSYVLPRADARRMAVRVTVGLVVLAIIGAVTWLTSERIDLYEVIGVLTVITVVVGVTATVLLAQKAGVTDGTRNRLAIAALLVSLIVPGGVAAIFAMWWFVFGVVFIYWAYQRAFSRFAPSDGLSPEGRLQRWRVDRLAIELVLIMAIGVAGIVFQIAVLQALLYRARVDYGLIQLLGLGLGIGGLYFVIRHYSSGRAKGILRVNADTYQGRELRLMSRDLWLHSLYWFLLAGAASALTFFGQMMAYGWFTSLLKTTISRG